MSRSISHVCNKEKCKFEVIQVRNIGHVLTPKGVHPDPEKIKAIHHMPPPTDQKCVEWLLGTVNYFAKLVPNVSTITIPIQDVLKKDFFHWNLAQNNTFAKIKDTLSSAPLLAFRNVNKPVIISCNMSQSGLGALLLQNGKPVEYASCALFSEETRHA